LSYASVKKRKNRRKRKNRKKAYHASPDGENRILIYKTQPQLCQGLFFAGPVEKKASAAPLARAVRHRLKGARNIKV